MWDCSAVSRNADSGDRRSAIGKVRFSMGFGATLPFGSSATQFKSRKCKITPDRRSKVRALENRLEHFLRFKKFAGKIVSSSGMFRVIGVDSLHSVSDFP